jgi:hypothetical protein
MIDFGSHPLEVISEGDLFFLSEQIFKLLLLPIDF